MNRLQPINTGSLKANMANDAIEWCMKFNLYGNAFKSSIHHHILRQSKDIMRNILKHRI